MTGIDHQPFKVRLLNQSLKEFFPYPFVSPTDKALMHSPPFAILRRQITPRRTGAQYPEHRIYEQTIIPCNASPLPALPWQVRLQQGPSFIRYVMTALWICHKEHPLLVGCPSYIIKLV